MLVDKINQSNFGEHNLIFYKDAVTLNKSCLEYCKTAIESLNEMILILTYYESVSKIFQSLKNAGLDTERYKLQGSLVIVDSKKAYFSLVTNELVDIMIMVKMLLQRSNKLGKRGLTVFGDMGLFFNQNRINDLMKHEIRLSSCSSSFSAYNNKIKIFCCYAEIDFELLPEDLKQDLLNGHNRVMRAEIY